MDDKKGHTDDLFDEIVMAEERFQEKGFKEGLAMGRDAGLQEGFSLGWEKGAALGSEIGFYRGFSENLKQLMNRNPQMFKDRCLKSVSALAKMTEEFTIGDPREEKMFEELNTIRSKFKQVSSLLNLQVGSESGSEKKGLSF